MQPIGQLGASSMLVHEMDAEDRDWLRVHGPRQTRHGCGDAGTATRSPMTRRQPPRTSKTGQTHAVDVYSGRKQLMATVSHGRESGG
jgi:hypothetical protein